MSDQPERSWGNILRAYLTKFGDAPVIPDDLPPERIAEAMTLLEQAVAMNAPFVSDAEFRRALNLTPKTTP